MRKLRWSPNARRQYDEWLSYLAARSEPVARNAYEETESAVAHLPEHPFQGRSSRWLGVRELVLRRWRKIVVYRVTETEIRVVCIFDGRRNLAAMNPRFE